METYSDFAGVYDTFMDDTPYEEWAEYIIGLLKEYGIAENKAGVNKIEENSKTPDDNLAAERNIVLDLGCGTGTLTELIAAAGYDMIGIDNSREMLNIAHHKKEKSGQDILYLCQDMRELELYGTVGAVISVCDSLNYLLKEEEILHTFRLVNNYLYPGGIFIFDFNTVYKYEAIGDATIAENREDCSFIWENYYHDEEEINEYDLTIFVQMQGMKKDAGYFRRFVETHYQRGYRLPAICTLLEKAGMEFISAVDADTHGRVREESERIYVIAREQGKEQING